MDVVPTEMEIELSYEKTSGPQAIMRSELYLCSGTLGQNEKLTVWILGDRIKFTFARVQ